MEALVRLTIADIAERYGPRSVIDSVAHDPSTVRVRIRLPKELLAILMDMCETYPHLLEEYGLAEAPDQGIAS